MSRGHFKTGCMEIWARARPLVCAIGTPCSFCCHLGPLLNAVASSGLCTRKVTGGRNRLALVGRPSWARAGRSAWVGRRPHGQTRPDDDAAFRVWGNSSARTNDAPSGRPTNAPQQPVARGASATGGRGQLKKPAYSHKSERFFDSALSPAAGGSRTRLRTECRTVRTPEIGCLRPRECPSDVAQLGSSRR
jgi:hypothetical protein